MRCNDSDRMVELADGDLLKLDNARGRTVRVPAGTLWITQQDDRRDVVLRAGDVWTVEREGLTLGQAQGATRVCVDGDAQTVQRRHRPAGFGRSLANLLTSYAGMWSTRRAPYY